MQDLRVDLARVTNKTIVDGFFLSCIGIGAGALIDVEVFAFVVFEFLLVGVELVPGEFGEGFEHVEVAHHVAEFLDEGELVNLHFTFGVFIRNQFGLWNENADLLNDCRKLSGITFMNADDAAAFIIGELWKRLNKTHKLRVVK